MNDGETAELTELVPKLAERLVLSEPLTAETYMCIDSEAPATEEIT